MRPGVHARNLSLPTALPPSLPPHSLIFDDYSQLYTIAEVTRRHRVAHKKRGDLALTGKLILQSSPRPKRNESFRSEKSRGSPSGQSLRSSVGRFSATPRSHHPRARDLSSIAIL